MNDINDLRTELFDTIKQLKAGKLDIGQANAVANLAGRVIDSAKVETDYVRAFGGRASIPSSGFIGRQPKLETLEHQAATHGEAPSPQHGRGLPPAGPKAQL